MFPWLWIFAPSTRFPWSGAVDQQFTMDQFFRAMTPGAGDPEIEKRAFEQASYGKQLGWLTDIVVDAIGAGDLKSPEARKSLARLEELHAKIGEIKREHRRDRADAAIALLDRIRDENPEELRRVLRRYEPTTSVKPRPNTRPAK